MRDSPKIRKGRGVPARSARNLPGSRALSRTRGIVGRRGTWPRRARSLALSRCGSKDGALFRLRREMRSAPCRTALTKRATSSSSAMKCRRVDLTCARCCRQPAPSMGNAWAVGSTDHRRTLLRRDAWLLRRHVQPGARGAADRAAAKWRPRRDRRCGRDDRRGPVEEKLAACRVAAASDALPERSALEVRATSRNSATWRCHAPRRRCGTRSLCRF
jgi:hypothetical protein